MLFGSSKSARLEQHEEERLLGKETVQTNFEETLPSGSEETSASVWEFLLPNDPKQQPPTNDLIIPLAFAFEIHVLTFWAPSKGKSFLNSSANLDGLSRLEAIAIRLEAIALRKTLENSVSRDPNRLLAPGLTTRSKDATSSSWHRY